MADYALIARYVQALFDGLADDQIGQVQQEVAAAAELWHTCPELRRVLVNPFIPLEEKRTTLDRVAERADWLEAVSSFLGVLLENGRISLLDRVALVVADFVRARLGREIATIETPVPLSDDESDRLVHRLGAKLGVTLIPKVEMKPELIGGLRVRVGDTMYDASVAGNLAGLRDELTTKGYTV
jgi:F-type H+-transporting ATPase subunit delta